MVIAEAGPVRVTRNGNARTLAIPAEIAAAARIEVGEQFLVELVEGNLIYRRLGQGRSGRFVGEGSNRFLDLPQGATVPVGPDPSSPPPIDWDY